MLRVDLLLTFIFFSWSCFDAVVCYFGRIAFLPREGNTINMSHHGVKITPYDTLTPKMDPYNLYPAPWFLRKLRLFPYILVRKYACFIEWWQIWLLELVQHVRMWEQDAVLLQTILSLLTWRHYCTLRIKRFMFMSQQKIEYKNCWC